MAKQNLSVGQQVTLVGESGEKSQVTVAAVNDDGRVNVRGAQGVIHPGVPVGPLPEGNAHIILSGGTVEVAAPAADTRTWGTGKHKLDYFEGKDDQTILGYAGIGPAHLKEIREAQKAAKK